METAGTNAKQLGVETKHNSNTKVRTDVELRQVYTSTDRCKAVHVQTGVP